MWSENGTISLSTPESYADVLRSVRGALETRGLRVLCELDVAERIEQNLGVRLPQCKILFVWPHPSPAEDLRPEAAAFLPLHVVVASRGHHTDIWILRRIHLQPMDANDLLTSIVTDTQSEILQSLETLSMRPSLV